MRRLTTRPQEQSREAVLGHVPLNLPIGDEVVAQLQQALAERGVHMQLERHDRLVTGIDPADGRVRFHVGRMDAEQWFFLREGAMRVVGPLGNMLYEIRQPKPHIELLDEHLDWLDSLPGADNAYYLDNGQLTVFVNDMAGARCAVLSFVPYSSSEEMWELAVDGARFSTGPFSSVRNLALGVSNSRVLGHPEWWADPVEDEVQPRGQEGDEEAAADVNGMTVALAALETFGEEVTLAVDGPLKPHEQAALDSLAEPDARLEAELCERLFDDWLHHREADVDDVEKFDCPARMRGSVVVQGARFLDVEHDGLGYLELVFANHWRFEHGLYGVLWGRRWIGLGGADEARGQAERHAAGEVPTPPRLAKSDPSFRVSERWAAWPHSGPVKLSRLAGLEGPWRVVVECDEDDEPSSGQLQAATVLDEDGARVGSALTDTLLLCCKSAEGAPRSTAELKRKVKPHLLRLSDEEFGGLAYTVFQLHAPWRKTGKITVVMHGSRVVGVTPLRKAASLIDEDIDRLAHEAKAARGSTARRRR